MRLDLLEAVRDVLKDQGFINLNINNVAQKADVDRNAIYRHFGNFDNLLSQYIESKDYWLDSLENVKDLKIENHKEFFKQMLFSQYETMNSNTELQQLIVWELSELSLRTKTIAQRREDLSEKLIKQFEEHFNDKKGIDFNLYCAVMIAGFYYLIIHKRHSTFCLIDFVKEKKRIMQGIDQMIEILFDARDRKVEKIEIAQRALDQGIDNQTVSEITGLSLDEVNELL